MIIAMVASGLFFGWTIGSHYTGATMGMAYGSGVIKSPLVATILIAVFVLLGATLESKNVVTTVGTGIIRGEDMTPLGAMVMLSVKEEKGFVFVEKKGDTGRLKVAVAEVMGKARPDIFLWKERRWRRK